MHISEICNLLSERKTVLLFLPRSFDSRELVDEIWDELVRRSMNPEEMEIEGGDASVRPVLAIQKQFNLPIPSIVEPKSFQRYKKNPPDVLFVHGGPLIGQDLWDAWVQFGTHWGQFSTQIDRPMPLCIFLPLDLLSVTLPDSDVRLAFYCFWSFPSALDIRLYCRTADQGTIPQNRRLWREHMLATLSGGDPQLAEFLWDKVFGSTYAIRAAMREYALKRGWGSLNEEVLQLLIVERCNQSDGRSPMSLPSSLAQQWARGSIVHTVEYGWEAHPALLALLDKDRLVEQRLWRGQSALLLPILEITRWRICESLSETRGRRWQLEEPSFIREFQRKELEEDSFAVEWGLLLQLAFASTRIPELKPLRPLVEKCQEMRNRLAHHECVDFADFEKLTILERNLLN